MKYKIVVPSHKRSDIIKQSIICSMPPVDHCELVVVVREGQEDDYKKVLPSHVRIHTVDFAGLAKTRNYILKEMFTEDMDFIIMLDDDVKNLKFTLSRIVKKVEPIQIYEVIEDTYSMCLALGANYFGFADAMGSAMALTSLRFKPISLSSRVSATLSGYIKKGRYFDPNIDIFEDMDYTLQSIFSDGLLVKNNMYFCEQIGGEDVDVTLMELFRSGIILKDNRYGIDCILKMHEGEGGMSEFRSTDKIRAMRQQLYNKYGMGAEKYIRRAM